MKKSRIVPLIIVIIFTLFVLENFVFHKEKVLSIGVVKNKYSTVQASDIENLTDLDVTEIMKKNQDFDVDAQYIVEVICKENIKSKDIQGNDVFVKKDVKLIIPEKDLFDKVEIGDKVSISKLLMKYPNGPSMIERIIKVDPIEK